MRNITIELSRHEVLKLMQLCLQAEKESETSFYRFLHDRILNQLIKQDIIEENRYNEI